MRLNVPSSPTYLVKLHVVGESDTEGAVRIDSKKGLDSENGNN